MGRPPFDHRGFATARDDLAVAAAIRAARSRHVCAGPEPSRPSGQPPPTAPAAAPSRDTLSADSRTRRIARAGSLVVLPAKIRHLTDVLPCNLQKICRASAVAIQRATVDRISQGGGQRAEM